MGAIREALDLELAADPDVFVMGEDVGRVGGLFRATEGLYERYGAERIRDTPLTESGFVGCGIGAALTGSPSGGRAPVLRLRGRRLRPDHEPGGEAAVHDGRHAEHAARAPHGLGRWLAPRRAALTEPGGAVLPHSRARRRDAVEPVRREGPPRGRDPGRQPRDLPRAEAPLLRRPGAGARGALRDRARQGECRQRGKRRHRSWRSARWSRTPSGSRASSRPRASTSRS